MKNLIPPKYLPLLTLVCGILGFSFRFLLYRTGVDDRGLLEQGHTLQLLCWICVAAGTLIPALSALHLDGSNRYADNFSASIPGALGSFAAAAAIAFTVLTGSRQFSDVLTWAWMALGITAAVCLAAAGVCRLTGKRPFFLLHSAVCVFFALNLANGYRAWSSNPQTQDYIFQLFACVLLTLSGYYHAAFAAEAGQRRPQLFCGLAGALLCLVSLAHTDNPLFYLGCGAWSLLNICSPMPPRRRRRAPQPVPEESCHASS